MNSLKFASLVVLGASAFVQGAKPTWDKLEGYKFEHFVADFKLNFPASELDMRRELFTSELKRVTAHNSKGLSWKEGINKFSAMSVQEKKAHLGYSKNHAYAHKKILKHSKIAPLNKTAVSELPASVDWRNAGIATAVKDQGHCGSCWAFAATAVMESYVAIGSGLLFDLSVQQTAMCAPNPAHCGGVGGCEGSTAELAFEWAAGSKGLYQEYQVPYSSYYGTDYACDEPTLTQPVATIGDYVKLPNNDYDSVMNAISSVGPLAINVDASTWHAYESGIYNGCNDEQPDVNHVVVMMGYGEDNGEKYWLVRNSWSAAWGEQGYVRLARQDAAEEPCGMDTTPTDGVECEGNDAPVQVCGTCGAIYDSSYILDAAAK